jgi:peptidyl-prolyl cis-trans isomerase B (cyclophilin B)
MTRKLFNLPYLAIAVVAMLAIAPLAGAAESDGLPVRNTGHYAIIDSDRGTIVIELYPAVAPKTVENFETLVKKGYYNGLTFHRVEPGFVVQGGDPNGNGTGGPGYTVPAEISPTEHHLRGTLAMARTGDDVNPQRASSGSQFYICLEAAPFLDNNYTSFGGVIKGMDVVDKIRVGDHMKNITLAKEPPK